MVICISEKVAKVIEEDIEVHDHVEIKLSDSTILSARIWLPKDASSKPVPAILEYLPYPKQDMTAVRDALNHPYVAAQGYACIRADMRGAGNSEGVLRGEYLNQEQDDGLEVLRWIAGQDWCTGSVGMIGISWGGFNGLQIAARRPPELKAVISICSTDDRYDCDIHYMGGCLLVENFLWASSMFSINASPPDPKLLGNRWRQIWKDRIEEGGIYFKDWHNHQRRDAFFRHASICEDYSAIQCPVFLVGGWMDQYHKTIFRMLEKLQCPKKGLVGPWAHLYPNFAIPRPQIGFLQESVRWWDRWLKGKDTGIMEDPMLQCYLMDTVAPKTHYGIRPGRWVAEGIWPSSGVEMKTMGLAPGQLTEDVSTSTAKLSICSPQTTGFASHRWLVFGKGNDGPSDQRIDEGGSLIFDSGTIEEPLDLLGAVTIKLQIAADKPNAIAAAIFSEILPDGSITRLSFGVLNLTHRNSHVDLEKVDPGRFYDVGIRLDECGQHIKAGNKLRFALSSAFFPSVWPSPEPVTLIIDCSRSTITLPVRHKSPLDNTLRPFEPPVNAPALKTKQLREPSSKDIVSRDLASDKVTMLLDHDDGLFETHDSGWQYGVWNETKASISPNVSCSGTVETRFRNEFGRTENKLAVEGRTKMTMTLTDMHITAELVAYEDRRPLYTRQAEFCIPRDHV